MAESALERYFDNFIANDGLKTEEKEVNEEEEEDEEVFCSLLSDKLLTLHEENTDSSSTRLDCNSQNSTAMSADDSSTLLQEVSPPTPVMKETLQPKMPLQIHNVTATVKLGCCLDLSFIARTVWNVEYQPKVYPAVTMRIRDPQTTAVVYKSGNMVCSGAKSVLQARLAARKCARKVQKLGFPVRFLNFQIQNLVASCNTFPVTMELLAKHQHCSYEPELFPGIHYKVTPDITATIFASGKISLTGAKEEAQIYEAFDVIYPVVSCYRRK